MIDKISEEKLNKIRTVLKFIFFIFFTFGIPLIIYINNKDLFNSFTSIKDASDYITSYGNKSVLIYMGLQVFQVVIALIPAHIVEMASGYIFGIGLGLIYTTISLVIGTIIDYYIAKILGRGFVELVIPKKDVEKYTNLLNSKKGILICFVTYLIPGFPKDIVSYVSGLTGIDFKLFIVVSTIGRMPGCIGSVVMGSLLEDENITIFLIILIFASLCLILAMIFKDKIIAYIDNLELKNGKKRAN